MTNKNSLVSRLYNYQCIPNANKLSNKLYVEFNDLWRWTAAIDVGDPFGGGSVAESGMCYI